MNRLFVFSFNNGELDLSLSSFEKYYMPLVEIKDFNGLIDNKLIKTSRNDDCTTGNLLDFSYHQKLL